LTKLRPFGTIFGLIMKRLIEISLILATFAFAQVWVARYNSNPDENPDDVAFAIVLDAQYNVYVTGYSPIDYHVNYDYATIKYDRNGIEQWVARYNGPGDSTDQARAIGIDAQENIYVTGFSYGGSTNNDFATIKYNNQGETIWVARYNGPANNDDQAYAMAVSPQGDIYVTGYCSGIGTYWDYCTIRYNTQGETIWVARYNGPGNSNDAATAIALDLSGNCYVTGSSPSQPANYDMVTIKYNPAGETVWVARYNGTGNDFDKGVSIAVNETGNVWVTGISIGADTSYDYVTIRYNPDGSEHWVARYNGPDNKDDRANALTLDENNNVYITGSSTTSNFTTDFITIKYDSSGTEHWNARYNGLEDNNDYPNAIVVDRFGNVCVCGYSQSNVTLKDFVTVKYNPSGETCWVTVYNYGVNLDDIAYDLTTDDSGYVYVTGYSFGAGTFRDYVTIKYYPSGYLKINEIADNPISENKIKIFPNPVKNIVNVTSSMPVQIFNISGQLVTTLKPGINKIQNLSKGIYFAKDKTEVFSKFVVLPPD
jgi:uncharacterized delta-60 repeat protein